MRSPAEYYIKYLLSDRSRSLTDVLEKLGKSDISVEYEYVEGLQRSLRFPSNYSPLDVFHAPSRNFLKREKIWGLWHPDMPTREAAEAYKIPGIREQLCTAILSGYTREAVVRIVLETKGVCLMPETVDTFAHYFWNTNLLTRSELTTLFLSDDTAIHTNYLAALRALKNHPAGGHLTLYKMGIATPDLQQIDMYKTVRDLAYYNVCETDTFAQGRNKSEMFRNYVASFMSACDKIEALEEASQDILEDFANVVRLSTGGKEPPLIADVVNQEG